MNTVKYYWVSLRKIKGNFYARVRWKNAWNLKQEQTITLKTDKEHYVKKHPGDSITINVAVVIDKQQKSGLQSKSFSPDGLRLKFTKIFVFWSGLVGNLASHRLLACL